MVPSTRAIESSREATADDDVRSLRRVTTARRAPRDPQQPHATIALFVANDPERG